MDNLSILRKMFPEVDGRIIKATLHEDNDLEKAIEFIRSEVLDENSTTVIKEEMNRDMVERIVEQAKADKDLLSQFIQEMDELWQKDATAQAELQESKLRAEAAEAALRESKLRASAASQELLHKAATLHSLLVQKREVHAMRAGELLSEKAMMSMESKRQSILWESIESRIVLAEQAGRNEMRLAQQLGKLEDKMAGIEQEFMDLNIQEVENIEVKVSESLIEDGPSREISLQDSEDTVINNAPPEVLTQDLASPQKNNVDENGHILEQNTPVSQVWDNNNLWKNRAWDNNNLAQAWENVKLSPQFVSTLSSQDYDDQELQFLVNSVQSLSNSMNSIPSFSGSMIANGENQEMQSDMKLESSDMQLESDMQSDKASNGGGWHFVEDED